MKLIDCLTILVVCDECDVSANAPAGASTYQAAQDFAEDGWIVKGSKVLCPACKEDAD